jgi:hypothetical protein
MGKNRSASGLTNVIQYDNNGNIAFVSGSTTLMQVSSSGAITITGTISGSDAVNALLLNGTGSLAFVTTASYNVASSSFSSRTTQVERTYATTGSNTFTGPQFASDTSNAISFTSTASLYSDGGLRVQGNSFVSGTAYFNNIVVYGTSSIQYITSSQVNVGTNIITVNTDTPAVRFGGLAVFDSGSTQLTGSMLWDSEKNHWVYSNPSGSSYSGGMLISGPRSSALGSEQGTTACMLLVGQGGDHLTSSLVYHSTLCTNFYSSSLFVSSSGYVGVGTNDPNASLHINGTPGQNNPSLRLTDSAASGNGGNVYISADKTGVGYNNLTTIAFSHTFKGGGSATNYLTIDSNGISCFACQVCAPGGAFTISTTNGGLNIKGVAATPPNLAYLANNYFPKFYTRPDANYGITIFDQSEAVAIQAANLVSGTCVRSILLNPYGGNVGIGTSSPTETLHLNSVSTNAAFIRFQNTGGSGVYVGGRDNNMELYAGGSERIKITCVGTVQPGANGTQDLGTSSLRWATVYTSDLSMSNGIGDYTIVEGREDLFLYNNITNKVFKFALIEIDPSKATPKIKK